MSILRAPFIPLSCPILNPGGARLLRCAVFIWFVFEDYRRALVQGGVGGGDSSSFWRLTCSSACRRSASIPGAKPAPGAWARGSGPRAWGPRPGGPGPETWARAPGPPPGPGPSARPRIPGLCRARGPEARGPSPGPGPQARPRARGPGARHQAQGPGPRAPALGPGPGPGAAGLGPQARVPASLAHGKPLAGVFPAHSTHNRPKVLRRESNIPAASGHEEASPRSDPATAIRIFYTPTFKSRSPESRSGGKARGGLKISFPCLGLF